MDNKFWILYGAHYIHICIDVIAHATDISWDMKKKL
jgi:hypothetical protein